MSDQWTTPGDGEADETPVPPAPPAARGQVPTPPPPPPPPGAWASPTAPPQDQHVASIPLRPLALGEVLDAVFRLLRKVALPAAIATLLVLGPIQVLAALGTADSLNVLEQLNDPEAFAAANPDPFAGLNAMAALGGLLSIFASTWIAPALLWLGLRSDDDPLPSVGTVLARGWTWFPRLLGANVLLGLGVLLPLAVTAGIIAALGAAVGGVFLVLFLPWVLLLLVGLAVWVVVSALLVPVVVIEGQGATDSLRRAYSLWRGRFWPLVGYFVVGFVVVQLLAGAVSFPFTLPALLGVRGGVALVAVGGIVSVLIATPINTFYALAVYFDTRVRTEGYDVAVQARRLS